MTIANEIEPRSNGNNVVARRTTDLDEFRGNDEGYRPQATVEVAMNRAAQEVQAAMAIAKRFPRDQAQSYARIMQACNRKGLAAESMYEYQRGGSKITGPSIRLAEALAQNWGNLDFGIIELEQREGESQVMAYAWDLETNVRQVKIFAVPHERHTRERKYSLTDPRDIYETVANNGARRLRACILGVIPGDVVDAAVEKCEQTLKKAAGDKPLGDRIRDMLAWFATELNVKQEAIETLLMHKAEVISENELIRLRKIGASIRDGMSSVEDVFKPREPQPGSTETEQRIRNGQRPQSTPAAPSPRQAPPATASSVEPSPAPTAKGEGFRPEAAATTPSQPESATEQPASGEGGEQQQPSEEDVDATCRWRPSETWPARLPDEARRNVRWIDDHVTLVKPSHYASAHAAKADFHRGHAPRSWTAIEPEMQDELYEALATGEFPWPAPPAPSIDRAQLERARRDDAAAAGK